jgi:hypothetical protein
MEELRQYRFQKQLGLAMIHKALEIRAFRDIK